MRGVYYASIYTFFILVSVLVIMFLIGCSTKYYEHYDEKEVELITYSKKIVGKDVIKVLKDFKGSVRRVMLSNDLGVWIMTDRVKGSEWIAGTQVFYTHFAIFIYEENGIIKNTAYRRIFK